MPAMLSRKEGAMVAGALCFFFLSGREGEGVAKCYAGLFFLI
jgi:hypothetical protein